MHRRAALSRLVTLRQHQPHRRSSRSRQWYLQILQICTFREELKFFPQHCKTPTAHICVKHNFIRCQFPLPLDGTLAVQQLNHHLQTSILTSSITLRKGKMNRSEWDKITRAPEGERSLQDTRGPYLWLSSSSFWIRLAMPCSACFNCCSSFRRSSSK